MPVVRRLLSIVVLTCGVLYTGYVVAGQRLESRLKEKAAEAQIGVKSVAARGGDPSAVLAVMQQVKPALDAGDPKRAEALLDRALSLLAEAGKSLPSGEVSPLPIDPENELPSDLYVNPRQVSIAGYDGSAMEPFISPDGRHLFFNNKNAPNTNTNLYFAERTGALTFRFLGELKGANSPVLDAAPSIDMAGHFYFTTVRDYDRTMNSLYTGEFDGAAISNLRPVPGDISPTTPGTINMDVSISPDGQTLYISRALIFPGALAPKRSQLMIARLEDGAFRIDPDGGRILQNVNTNALQYAPSITRDGLEVYFTRASKGGLRIMVATRASTSEPFSPARVLKALSGFVEAPSVSLDRKELFFHKKVGDKFAIYRAERNP